MNNKELIARYIYAVTKYLPKKSRHDVAEELKSVISDMLEEHCGDREPELEELRAVLTELGMPSELADKYNTDRQKALIGGVYYTQYKLVLKIVLFSIALGLPVAGIVLAVLDPSLGYTNFASWLATFINTLVSAFAYVTLLFALFYHKGVKIEKKHERLEDLPPVPTEKLRISRGETAFGIALSIIFAVIFLLTPQLIFVYFKNGGGFIPIFDVQELQKTWYLVAGMVFVGIIKESIRLIDGRYTRRVMVVTLVTNLISAVLSSLWLSNDRLINPALGEGLRQAIPDGGGFIMGLASNAQRGFLGFVIFFLVLDGALTVYKTLKYEEAWR